jgi:hypothetical protein
VRYDAGGERPCGCRRTSLFELLGALALVVLVFMALIAGWKESQGLTWLEVFRRVGVFLAPPRALPTRVAGRFPKATSASRSRGRSR